VKGTRGEFWPVKGSIFAETYERVEEEASATAPTATPDLRDTLHTAIRAFQIDRHQPGGYDQQLTDHLVRAVADPAPDFFQPGVSYRLGRFTFACTGIETRAVGQLTEDGDDLPEVHVMDPDDWAHGGWNRAEVTGP
jgi:hypothetical protein